MCYKRKTKHCMANRPHLFELRLCLNLPTPHTLCFRQPHNLSLVTLLLDLRDPVHSQLHPNLPHHTSLYHKLHQPDLRLRIQRLCHLFLSLENMGTLKHLFTCAYSISMDTLLNLEWNKTRSPGSCHTCRPVQLVPGASMSWLKSSKKPCGTIQQTNFCKRSSDGSVTRINEPRCL